MNLGQQVALDPRALNYLIRYSTETTAALVGPGWRIVEVKGGALATRCAPGEHAETMGCWAFYRRDPVQ